VHTFSVTESIIWIFSKSAIVTNHPIFIKRHIFILTFSNTSYVCEIPKTASSLLYNKSYIRVYKVISSSVEVCGHIWGSVVLFCLRGIFCAGWLVCVPGMDRDCVGDSQLDVLAYFWPRPCPDMARNWLLTGRSWRLHFGTGMGAIEF